MKEPNILLVDDCPINLIFYKAMLQSMGYETECADNGHEAVSLLSKKKFELILLDRHMTPTDGLEVLQTIRSIQKFRTLPIIVFSGDKTSTNRTNCFIAGATDFLEKPCSIQLMTKTLEKYFDHSRSQTNPH